MRREIGRFALHAEIGQGAMGTVYLGSGKRTGNFYAIKVLDGMSACGHEHFERFRREAETQQLINHPNVLACHEVGADGDHLFLVLDWIDGVTLKQLGKQLAPLEVPNTFEILRQVAEGLVQLNKHALVHRDIKPSNLMLARDGVVKILDLGLVHVRDQTTAQLTRPSQIIGTLDFLAPEQLNSERQVDIRADLFAVGCTAFQLFSRRSPFKLANKTFAEALERRRTTPARSLSTKRPDLPNYVIETVDRLLMTDPDERFQSPEELIRAVEPMAKNHDLKEVMHAFPSSTASGVLRRQDL